MSPAELQNAIEKVRNVVSGSDRVINVRGGFLFSDGWITSERCVVVSCRPDSVDEVRTLVPENMDGVPVDVTPATPQEQLAKLREGQGDRGERADEVVERFATPGVEILEEADMGGRGLAQEYEPPPDAELTEVKAAMTLTCHTSPDAGWPTLHEFLDGVKKRLTIGIYDFTAPHVADGLKAAVVNAEATLKLLVDPSIALSHGGGNNNPKKDDRKETDIRDDYIDTFGDKFEFNWAAVKRAGKTTGGIFPSAYHIKVAVRDGKSFWLSSGNLQSTNQPNIHPAKLTDAKNRPPKLFSTFNREWHILVDNTALAKTFERFLEWDFEQAGPLQDDSGDRGFEAMPMLMVPEIDVDTRAERRFFTPKTFKFTADKPCRIQPLLTPDNFAEHILKLVKSARHTLYIQNQYIKVTDKASPKFLKLVDAIIDRFNKGVDVRVILRDLGETRPMLEALQDHGFPVECVKLQAGCHNKGILVDSKVMAIGSHNWSSDGTTRNRDATLIIRDADVTAFYEEIFLFDWDNLAKQKTFADRGITVVDPEEGTRGGVPEGMQLVPWDALYED